jgi:glycosyltransferase involved in cell wall biosynthesis
MGDVRTAFVMEQTLGHKTHYRNLRDAVANRPDVSPIWLPIPFDLRGAERFVPLLRSNWSVRASWRARGALKSAIARQGVDALFFHTQVTALFSRRIMRQIPTVISLDATPVNYDSVGEFYEHRPAGNGMVDRRKFEMNRSAFHSAAALVTWSHWTKQSLVDDYGVDQARIKVLSPGAGASYFDIGAARQPKAHTSPRKRTRLLFVGGNFARKGGPLLLECMRGGLSERCELDIVTQDPVPAQPHVRVHHGIGPNSPELRALFAFADIFVLPTNADCLALVLMEAAAAGLPVVSTTVGALGEAFISQQTGLDVPRADPAALCQAINALVNDEPRRQRMGRAAHALALKSFDSRQNNSKLIDLITDVAFQKSAARRVA